MILSQAEIRKAVKKGDIKFDPPLLDKQWAEASINLRLDTKLTQFQFTPSVKFSMVQGMSSVADSGLLVEKELRLKDDFGKKETFCLELNEFVLALTN
jgi:deoxycytidine triphosphate deaminase